MPNTPYISVGIFDRETKKKLVKTQLGSLFYALVNIPHDFIMHDMFYKGEFQVVHVVNSLIKIKNDIYTDLLHPKKYPTYSTLIPKYRLIIATPNGTIYDGDLTCGIFIGGDFQDITKLHQHVLRTTDLDNGYLYYLVNEFLTTRNKVMATKQSERGGLCIL